MAGRGTGGQVTGGARPPRPPPPRPPVRLVALAALQLDPDGPAASVLAYLRSTSVGTWMREIEIRRFVDEQVASGLDVVEAERVAALRHGVSVRTLRRRRTGR